MAQEKKLDTAQWTVLGLVVFGVSWLLGTAIGWGLSHDAFLTFVTIGVIPSFCGLVVWLAMSNPWYF